MHINPQLLHQVLLPALAGAAGTGALSAHISSNYHPDNESPRDRRRRIIRNALIGASLGGVAGGALPTGVKMLTQPFREGSQPLFDQAVEFPMVHPLAAITAGVGGTAAYRSAQTNKRNAVAQLLKIFKSNNPAQNEPNMQASLSSLEGRKNMMTDYARHLAGKMPGGLETNHLFRANELMQEAGHKGLNLDEMDALMKPVEGLAGGRAREAYAQWLGEQGPISNLMSKLVTKTTPLRGFGVAPSQIAEGYGRYIRPGLGRLTPLTMAALVGGGALAANKLQNSATN